MDSDGQMSLFNEENEKEEPKIKLSPGDQAMIDYMDKPIDWERAERIMRLTKTYRKYMEEKKKEDTVNPVQSDEEYEKMED